MASHNNSMRPSTKKLKDMNIDEFFGVYRDSESESSSNKSVELKPKKMKGITKITNKKLDAAMKKSTINSKPPSAARPKPVIIKSSGRSEKQSLASTLQENDPEFYDFLKGQDKSLLENLEDLSDSDCNDDSLDTEEEDEHTSNNRKKAEKDEFEKELLNMSSGEESDSDVVHELPEKLEVASDASTDDEGEEIPEKAIKKGGIILNHKTIEKWTREMQSAPSLSVLREVVSAFHSAVQEAGGSDEIQTKYKVEGGSVFNSIVRLCLTQIVPALQTMLQLPTLSEVRNLSEKSGRWRKLKVLVKSYIVALLELLKQLSEAAMVNAILKQVHKLIIFYANFPKITKLLLKRMINMWTTGEETSRVLAFLCINKLVRLRQDSVLESTLKQMYMAYVSNCKFTSPTTLPQINFMQKSLVEIFTIDQTVGYQYAFVYIRQLAIHLRNAISVKKKNTCQAVYNWQYIHCLELWVQLLTTTHPSDILQPLIYPLTQTIIGTIKLLPTARFYPLRFHCVQLLNKLSYKTKTFIPTLPFLLEIFEQTDFNKKHKTVSLKPFNFAVILKFSKSQIHEKAFKDGLIDQIYEHMLESFNTQAHSISFPEMIIPSVIQLKLFLKKCKIANYCKQIKQIVDKIQEQSKFISEKRRSANLGLDDQQSVAIWENQLTETGTPLRKFYTSWRKLRDRELQHELSNKEAISGAAIDIPTINRKKRPMATPVEREEFAKLFENDSDSEDETRFLLKEERPDRTSTKRKHDDSESNSDDYSDFDDDELEQLAQSASSGGEDDDVEMDEKSGTVDEKENLGVQILKPLDGEKKEMSKAFRKDNLVDKDDENDIVEEFALSDFDSD